MLRRVILLLVTFGVVVLCFVVQKPLFMTFYGGGQFWDVWAVMWHGLSMDCAMAGYLTIIPAIILCISCFTLKKWLPTTLKIYFGLISVLISAVCITDLVLYGYWGFRLDATPLFYFATSPSSALASATVGELWGGLAAFLALSAGFFAAFYFTIIPNWPRELPERRGWSIGVMALLTGGLFIPIRGGFTVSTMNLSRAYFSDQELLNHGAINPMFSLMYSLLHQGDFSREYRFMAPEEAARYFNQLTYAPADSTMALQPVPQHIYLVILESFSAHLMPSLGGEAVTMRLDSLGQQGWLFTQLYSSSFRTDRALPAILSGFPGQPSTSVMKYVRKAEHLPSIALQFRNHGYQTSYYYGGDANFTNMLAYLRSQGFEKVVSDVDFPVSERLSKWGVPDGPVFEKALKERSPSPNFTVIQTSSSHEPFEPPETLKRYSYDKRKNAFAYADSCLGHFVDGLRASPEWDRTLVVMVPDHLGGYPKPSDISSPASRHHIPLIMIGGAIKPKRFDTIGTQTDLASTLMALMGFQSADFPFSHNLLNPSRPQVAFFSEKEFIGLITPGDTTIYQLETNRGTGKKVTQAKAYLQTLYEHLTRL